MKNALRLLLWKLLGIEYYRFLARQHKVYLDKAKNTTIGYKTYHNGAFVWQWYAESFLKIGSYCSIANDVNLYKQLIYVPLYKSTANISLCYKTIFLNISNQYTGYRYTSADNKQFLNPYLVSNATVSYGFHIKKVNAQTTLTINNIFNSEYESIAYRPMPLRYAELSIKLNF